MSSAFADIPKFKLPWHWRVYFFLRLIVRRTRCFVGHVFRRHPIHRSVCPFCAANDMRTHPHLGFFKCFKCGRAGEIKTLPKWFVGQDADHGNKFT